jgi:hypothetical protein
MKRSRSPIANSPVTASRLLRALRSSSLSAILLKIPEKGDVDA